MDRYTKESLRHAVFWLLTIVTSGVVFCSPPTGRPGAALCMLESRSQRKKCKMLIGRRVSRSRFSSSLSTMQGECTWWLEREMVYPVPWWSSWGTPAQLGGCCRWSHVALIQPPARELWQLPALPLALHLWGPLAPLWVLGWSTSRGVSIQPWLIDGAVIFQGESLDSQSYHAIDFFSIKCCYYHKFQACSKLFRMFF